MHSFLISGLNAQERDAVANCILGWHFFSPTLRSEEISNSIQSCWADRDSYEVKVINGLGTDFMPFESRSTCEMQIHYGNGYNALLFVLRFDLLFSDREWHDIMTFYNNFGRRDVHSHGICVMVGGEDYYKQCDYTFKTFCKNAQGHLKQLLEMFQGRVVLFDTLTKDIHKQQEQMQSLMEMMNNVHRLPKCPESNKKFQEKLKNYFKDNSHLREDIRRYCCLLHQALDQVTDSLTQRGLQNIETKAHDLQKALGEIKQSDSKTFTSLRDNVKIVVKTIIQIQQDSVTHQVFERKNSDRMRYIQQTVKSLKERYLFSMKNIEEDISNFLLKKNKKWYKFN